ncbi:MAG: O-antigen ligase family protein [Actinobacteria bacterium]|nr:O-antigen ligase family protein [Actinomycetota bacterium]
MTKHEASQTSLLLWPMDVALGTCLVLGGVQPWATPYAVALVVAAYFLTFRRVPRIDRTNGIALVLAVWIIIVLGLNPLTSTGLLESSFAIPGLVLLVFLRDALQQGYPARRLAKFLVLSAIVAAASVVLFAQVPEFSNIELLNRTNSGVTTRASLSWININWAAYVIASGILVIFATVAAGRATSRPLRRWEFFVLVLGIAAGLGAINLTGTRGALVSIGFALVAGLGAWLFPRFVRWTLSLLIIFAFIPPATAAVVKVISLPTFADLLGRGDSDVLSGRALIWEDAQEVAADRPVTGYGVGGYLEVMPTGSSAHNIALSLQIGIGLVGLLLYLALVLSCLADSAVTRGNKHQSLVVAVILLAGLLPIWLTSSWEWAPTNLAVLALASSAPLMGRVRSGTPQVGGPG